MVTSLSDVYTNLAPIECYGISIEQMFCFALILLQREPVSQLVLIQVGGSFDRQHDSAFE